MATKKTWNADRILSVSAIIVSACALVVSVVQTRIMQVQQEKSVWPHVRWYTQCSLKPDSTGDFAIHVTNKGVGPAIIEKVTLRLDGVDYPNDSIGKVIGKMIHQDLRDVSEVAFDQTVMLPNDNIACFESTNPKQAFKIAYVYLDEISNNGRFDIIINYRDVYGNKFISTGKTKF
jgi:hypothetical protein